MIYEGQFMKDKFFGKGKYYRINGSIFLEGDFNEDKFCGKDYDIENRIIYTGHKIKPSKTNEWERQGIGKSYYLDGKIKYNGNWVENKKDGYGIHYYVNRNISYKGDYKFGKFNGYGEKFDITGTLASKGHWKNDLLVKLTLKDDHEQKMYQSYEFRDHFYVGNLVDTRKEGYGEYYSKRNGLKFMEGEHLNNKQNGFTKIFFQENDNHQTISYIGYKKNNEWEGPRCIYYPNGKLSSRQYCSKGQIDKEKLWVDYGKNGVISLSTSYKS